MQFRLTVISKLHFIALRRIHPCKKDKKNELQQKVERMGGIYANSFHDGVTHLICSLVRSKKYEVAVAKDVPIMTSDWLLQVWEKSKHDPVHATDPQFSR